MNMEGRFSLLVLLTDFLKMEGHVSGLSWRQAESEGIKDFVIGRVFPHLRFLSNLRKSIERFTKFEELERMAFQLRPRTLSIFF